MSVRQSYYTDANASQFDTQYSYGFQVRAANPFSPVSFNARALPVDPLAIDYRIEYDPNAVPGTPKLLGSTLNGTLRTAAVNVTGGWTRQAFALQSPTGFISEARNLVNALSDFRLKQSKFGGRVEFQYDFATSTMLNQRYIGFYNAQCCGVSFEYQAFNYSNQVSGIYRIPSDRRFNMSFTLAGVGSFSNFFGAFGGGMGSQ